MDSQPISEDIVRRLGFVRYLYGAAVEQSRLPEPMCASSVLTFHDAAELFLLLACKHKDTATPQTFMDHWEKLGHKLPNAQITQKQGMKELDKARANLKHFGIIPARDNIQEYLYTTKRFFEENTPTLFGVSFYGVSLADLVHNPVVRDTLKEALKLEEEGDLKGALGNVAIAFAKLVGDYRKAETFGFQVEPPAFRWTPSSKLAGRSIDPATEKINEQIYSLRKAIFPMQDAVAVIVLGLDYERYRRFRELTPEVAETKYREGDHFALRGGDLENLGSGRYIGSGQYEVKDDRFQSHFQPVATSETFRYCFDFVVDSAMRIQAS